MHADETVSLEELLGNGWGYHDSDSDRLAGELEAAAGAGVAPRQLPAFLHLAVHVIGEHLGDWPRALALGKRVLDGRAATPETAKAWGRAYVAAVLAGDALAAVQFELACLEAAGEEFGAALLRLRFMLVDALVASRRAGEAARLYRGALALADRFGQSASLDRTIAVASTNLGWELCEKPARDEEEDALMQLCAQTSLHFWRKCGDWINEERALYLRASASNAAGKFEAGLADADQALSIIFAHAERPLDAALLHLARARSLAAMADPAGSSLALAAADAAAATLAAPELRAQFAAERAKLSVDELQARPAV